MRYTRLIAEAWDLTTHTRKLTWFTLVPSFVAVIIFIVEVVWQYFLITGKDDPNSMTTYWEKVTEFWSFLLDSELLGWSFFIIIFFAFFSFILPAWIQATLILSVRQKFNKPESYFSLRHKIIEGFEHFFPLFEFRALQSPFDFTGIVLFTLMLYRADWIFEILLPVMIGFSIFALIAQVFLSFAPFFVVFEKVPFMQAVKKSIAFVFLHFNQTLGLALIMMLVNLRVILNAAVVLGVPTLIFGLAAYLSGSGWSTFLIVLAMIVGLGLVGLAAYFTALLEVFSVACWERTFTKLRAKQRELEAVSSAADEV